MKYKAILFHPSGDSVTDFTDRETITEVNEELNDMGSRWIFYPICFVVTENNRVISAAPGLEMLNRCKVSTVKRFLRKFWDKDADLICKMINDGIPLDIIYSPFTLEEIEAKAVK